MIEISLNATVSSDYSAVIALMDVLIIGLFLLLARLQYSVINYY